MIFLGKFIIYHITKRESNVNDKFFIFIYIVSLNQLFVLRDNLCKNYNIVNMHFSKTIIH